MLVVIYSPGSWQGLRSRFSKFRPQIDLGCKGLISMAMYPELQYYMSGFLELGTPHLCQQMTEEWPFLTWLPGVWVWLREP